MVLTLIKHIKRYWSFDIKRIDLRSKKTKLKEHSQYPLICDVNIGFLGEDWSYEKIDQVNQWLDENFPCQWKLFVYSIEQGFDCDTYYHFANQEVLMAFKLKWL